MKKVWIPLLAMGLFSTSLQAQVIVVDPGGAGAYRDLQQAIQAAPAGATLVVRGGTYGPLTIQRSLKILGRPTPRIQAPEGGAGAQPAAIQLVGTGSQRLVLDNLHIQGRADGSRWTSPGSALRGSGFAEVVVMDSTIHAPVWYNASRICAGADAIDLEGAHHLTLHRCDVRASSCDLGGAVNVMAAPGGGAAVRAPGAKVTLLESVLAGGDGPTASWNWFPTSQPCTCPGLGGEGGDGVIAAEVFRSDSAISGGQGGEVHVNGVSFGRQEAGEAVRANQLHPVSQARLLSTSPAIIGQPWSVVFPTSPMGGFLLAGPPRATPLAFGSEWFFLASAPIVMDLMPSTSTFGFLVPNRRFLIGTEVNFQVLDVLSTSLSAPLPVVIGF